MNQFTLFEHGKKLIGLREASRWASKYLDR